ncbi:MAG: sulfite exporter TauE/SafE family protein [Bacillota bacterium]
MDAKLVSKELRIEGMTCASCESRVENKLRKMKGVNEAKANLSNNSVSVSFDANVTDIAQISKAIQGLGYGVGGSQPKSDKMTVTQLLGIGAIIFALYLIINNTIGFNFIPQITQNMGFGILFVIGLITSLHCVIMCGGINLSQCISKEDEACKVEPSKIEKMKPSLMYNMGRVVSYTIIGGIVGALGAAVSFSGMAKGVVVIISGVFMVIMGLNMLNMFPWLRKITPRLPKFLSSKIAGQKRGRGPFIVGLLNGLMPCGPLQAMQVYALGTGSFIAGAGAMFFFSLGTVPLMFGLGAISTLLSSRFTKNMLKVGAILVMILGVIMLTRGLDLSGINLVKAANTGSGSIAKVEGNVQLVTTKLESGKYPPFTVQAGVPVKWTMQATAKDINGCNETLTVPEYGISKKLVPGDNVIEFTPTKEGAIRYTCWMGMISSTITVVKDVKATPASAGNSSGLVASASSNPGAASGTGGCCGAAPGKFANGQVPTDNIKVANIVDGKQEITVTVNDNGYTPAAFVVQKGVQLKVKFVPEKLSSCNATVVFPGLNGQIDLNTTKETPWLTPSSDITFQCGMNMLHGYIKVVDDLSKIDISAIKNEIKNYTPSQNSSLGGSGGCCG